MHTDIFNEVEAQVRELYKQLPDGASYHTLRHTKQVVDSVARIAEGEKFSQQECEWLQLAAWLHDVGYIDSIENHEEGGIKHATALLEKLGYTPEGIQAVCELILATDISTLPQNASARALRDADLSHLASTDYLNQVEALREEWAQLGQRTFTDAEWIQENIDFMQGHQWFTETAKSLYEQQKQHNIQLLKSI